MSQSKGEVPVTEEGEGEHTVERTGWKRVAVGTLKWGSMTALALFIIMVVGVFIAYKAISIPKPNELAAAQVSIIYYADGTSEMDRLVAPEANRESVPLDQVPEPVQQAHLAAEDRGFYTNSGVSASGILRAVKSGISGNGQHVGGSTITQQYVKNYFLSSDRTLSRKAREILLSIKIDGQLSKEEILENYLNTIYYGRGAYGIQSAARTYFDKDVSELTVSEGAVLASVINSPSLYDPANGDEALTRLTNRYAYVLDGMVEEGWLTADERAKYTKLPKIQPVKRSKFGSGPTGYISEGVRRELTTIGLSDDDIARGGLRITTTIDKKAQKVAVSAMKEHLPEKVTGGLVAIRPGDGAVVAMYGGADYAKTQLNSATQAILQAGSNFKPFALLAAVRDGLPITTVFNGNSPVTIGGVTINNFGYTSYGPVDMRRMTGRSINTAFVALNQRIGPDKTRQAAIDAGIPEDTPGLDDSLTNVLGSSSPHVIDMASAYSTIAAQGERSTPHLIEKITSKTSDYTYTAEPKTVRAFDKDITAEVTDALTYTVRPGGTATKLQGLGRDVAGKTGTSEQNKSAWFTGFVPQLTVSVGMYKPDKDGNATQMTDREGFNLTGGTIPADIFMDFMTPTLEGVPKEDFPLPTGLNKSVNTVTPTYTPPPVPQRPSPTKPPTTEPTTTTTPTTSKPTTTEPTKTEPTKTEPPKPTKSTPPPARPTPTGPTTPKPSKPPKPPKPEPPVDEG